MISEWMDSVLARASTKRRASSIGGALPVRHVETSVGAVRVYDSGSNLPCVMIVPDGPNVIEHYEALIGLFSGKLRVVCFDMPGFGYSHPRPFYTHSLDQGARAVLGVLDCLGIESAALAFSCANGFYALRAASLAPQRIFRLVLSQTPSLTAMHAWTARIIPRPLRIPVIGQVAAWMFRRKVAGSWYNMALPRTTDPRPFQEPALAALSNGSCFCLAGIVQGLAQEDTASLAGVTAPCTMTWGGKDRSHRGTDPLSLRDCVPQAEIIHFPDCGHFPDIEQPGRFATLLIEAVTRHA